MTMIEMKMTSKPEPRSGGKADGSVRLSKARDREPIGFGPDPIALVRKLEKNILAVQMWLGRRTQPYVC